MGKVGQGPAEPLDRWRKRGPEKESNLPPVSPEGEHKPCLWTSDARATEAATDGRAVPRPGLRALHTRLTSFHGRY